MCQKQAKNMYTIWEHSNNDCIVYTVIVTLLGALFNCLLIQISDQPFTCQQLKASRIISSEVAAVLLSQITPDNKYIRKKDQKNIKLEPCTKHCVVEYSHTT